MPSSLCARYVPWGWLVAPGDLNVVASRDPVSKLGTSVLQGTQLLRRALGQWAPWLLIASLPARWPQCRHSVACLLSLRLKPWLGLKQLRQVERGAVAVLTPPGTQPAVRELQKEVALRIVTKKLARLSSKEWTEAHGQVEQKASSTDHLQGQCLVAGTPWHSVP